MSDSESIEQSLDEAIRTTRLHRLGQRLGPAAGTLAARGTAALCALFSVAYTLNVLGSEARGRIGLAGAVLGAVMLLPQVATGAALAYLSTRVAQARLLRLAVTWGSLLAVLGVGLFAGYQVMPSLPPWWKLPIDLPLHLLLPSALMATLFSAMHLLRLGGGAIGTFNAMLWVQAVVQTVSNVVIITLIHKGVVGITAVDNFFISAIIGHGAGLLAGWVAAPMLAHRPTQGLTRQLHKGRRRSLASILLRKGAVAQVGNGLQFAAYRLAFFALANHLDGHQLGVYTTSVLFAEALWLIPQSLASVAFSRNASGGSLAAGRRVALRASLYGSFAVAAGLVVLLLLPDVLWRLALGPAGLEVRGNLVFLAPGAVAVAASAGLSSNTGATGRFGPTAIASAVGAAMSVLLFVVLPLVDEGLDVTGQLRTAALAQSGVYGASLLVLAFLFFRGGRAKGLPASG